MMIAAFDPAQQMAAANLSLALLGVFTIGLPALLIARANKTEENRKILNSALNPWNYDASSILDLAPVLDPNSVVEASSSMEEIPSLEISSHQANFTDLEPSKVAEIQELKLAEVSNGDEESLENSSAGIPQQTEVLAA